MAWIPNVNANELIVSSWGNTIRDHVVNTFATVADRDVAWPAPPNGAMCVTLDTNTLWQRSGGAWELAGAGRLVGFQYNTTDAAVNGPTTVLTASFNARVNCRYQLLADIQLGTASGTGGYTFNLFIDGAVAITRQGSWGVGGATAGPSFTISGVTNPLAAGPHTVRIDGTGGAGLFYQDGYLSIVDLGP